MSQYPDATLRRVQGQEYIQRAYESMQNAISKGADSTNNIIQSWIDRDEARKKAKAEREFQANEAQKERLHDYNITDLKHQNSLEQQQVYEQKQALQDSAHVNETELTDKKINAQQEEGKLNRQSQERINQNTNATSMYNTHKDHNQAVINAGVAKTYKDKNGKEQYQTWNGSIRYQQITTKRYKTQRLL